MWRRENSNKAPAPSGASIFGSAVMEEDEQVQASPKAEPLASALGVVGNKSVWVVVLAGGDGRRLEAVTRAHDGTPAPKQFCSFRDNRSLLRATLDRACNIVNRDHIVVVVAERHRPWWEVELKDLPRENVVAQPDNRGTAVAILCALASILRRDRSPLLLVMPSDHDVEEEDVMLRKERRALRAAAIHEQDLVLLGITPTHIDVEYGLIVPVSGQVGTSRKVMTFVEKPALSTAAQLMRRGAMWNSFVFGCTGSALYALYEDIVPALLGASLAAFDGGSAEPDALAMLFRDLPMRDFSRDLLQRNARRLRVIAVPACGWTDLGTPARLAAWLDRHREAAFWRTSGLSRTPGVPDDAWDVRSA